MLPKPLLARIQKAFDKRRLVAYHCWDDDPTIFLVGFVTAIHESRIVFDQVGPGGRPEDKNDSVDMDDIVWMDFDTDYLNGLELLHPVYEDLIGMKPTAGLKATNLPAVRKALTEAALSGEAVQMVISKEKHDAIIQAVEGDFFSYITLRDGGRPDGLSWTKIEVVTRIDRKTDRQIADRFLYEHRLRDSTSCE